MVEDEPNILELLAASLRYAGFEVVTAAAGRGGAGRQRHRPDLIVLDVMLPDMDGFDVIRRLRGGGARIPVVFLTARDATEDKIRGLTLGGDDYVTKPFSLEEVIARIRAVLRRTRGAAEPPPRLKFADLELDEDSHEVWRDGKQIQLSPTEFKLLRYFMSNANRVLSKMQILDHVWDYDFRGDTGIVESYVSVLRRKIDTTEPHLMHTLRGVGYVLGSRRPSPAMSTSTKRRASGSGQAAARPDPAAREAHHGRARAGRPRARRDQRRGLASCAATCLTRPTASSKPLPRVRRSGPSCVQHYCRRPGQPYPAARASVIAGCLTAASRTAVIQ